TGGVLAHGTQVLDNLSLPLILAWPLFGIATVRAGVLPRWSGLLQLASVPMMILGLSFFFLAPDIVAKINLPVSVTPLALTYYLLFVGYAWGGYALWTNTASVRESATQTDVLLPARAGAWWLPIPARLAMLGYAGSVADSATREVRHVSGSEQSYRAQVLRGAVEQRRFGVHRGVHWG